MKIVIINNGLAGGGIERASTSMANQFAKWGHEVYIVALYKSKHFLPLEHTIKFVEPERWSNGNRSYVLYMMKYVRKQIKLINPNTILAYNEWTNPYVLLALQGLKYPIYVSDRMSPLIPIPLVTRILKKFLYKKASGVIAQTQFAKKVISSKNNVTRIKVIPNPVNVINAISCPKKNIIVTVGRLTKEKGHKYLIEAFAKIEHTNWQLSIVGDGNQKNDLQELAKKLGIDNRIIFHGHLLNFVEQLSEARIFVLPSLSEGFPNAVIEAMSVPLPCIATRCTQAMDEVIEDGINGILIEKENSDKLAKVIDQLIDDEMLQKRLAQNAYKVRDTLFFEKIAKEYLNYISGKLN